MRRVPQWHLKLVQRQGPNICVVEEVPELNRKFYTECRYWFRPKVCGYQTVLRYVCCEGYSQAPGEIGCKQEADLLNVVDTALQMGATYFVDYLAKSGLDQKLKHSKSTVTLFVPTNEAFESLTGIKREIFKTNLNSTLLYHITENRIMTTDMENEMMLTTSLQPQLIRVNKYANTQVSVNCIPVIRRDHRANNGVVHLIDGILIPPRNWPLKEISEVIAEDGRFNELIKFLNKTDVFAHLQENSMKSFTLFAPYDEAFQVMEPSLLDQLSEDLFSQQEIAKSHFIPYTICPFAITGHHKMQSLSKHNTELVCNQTGLYINDSPITDEIMLTQNGLVIVIDKVIIPQRVKTLYALIGDKRERLSKFKSVIDNCPQVAAALKSLNQSFTVFAPRNEAFSNLTTSELREIYANCEKFCFTHMVHDKVTTKEMANGQVLSSLQLPRTLECSISRRGFTVENSSIEEADIDARNGVLH
ncbi:transforming growth factor-beta-induced protein ig-h3-like protein, partial [Dinothrombium tinctorium]